MRLPLRTISVASQKKVEQQKENTTKLTETTERGPL